MSEDKRGPFSRRPDKRFVKKVVGFQHMPKNWVRMNLVDNEAKIMEIKKFSSAYFDFESKINSPGYELISAYNIQNAFLMGSYTLRKEQMVMQLGKGGSRERYLFYPVNSYADIDKICKMNIGTFAFRYHRETIMTFYFCAEKAMEVHEKNKPNSNPRALIYARVLLGQCSRNRCNKKQFFEEDPETGHPLHSWTDENASYAHKLTQSNDEVYPEGLLLYRRREGDEDGPSDAHPPRLESFLSSAIALSYRPGKRYNPEESVFVGNRVKRTSVKKVEEKKEVKPKAEAQTEAVIEMIPMKELSVSKE